MSLHQIGLSRSRKQLQYRWLPDCVSSICVYYPAKIYSDNGTQFRGANRELNDILKGLDWKNISNFAMHAGVEWKFSPSDASW